MQATGTVGEICNRDVVVTTLDTTVAAAAQLMRHHHVGTVIICEESKGGWRIPAGIVTDRDIVAVVAPGLDAQVITAGEIMGRDLVTARESHTLLQALETMRHKGVRRLPVLAQDGQLSGIIAIDDILEVLAEELTGISRISGRERGIEAASRK